jgi:mannitol-1-/sugar-/sorbitol-6-phosphatase
MPEMLTLTSRAILFDLDGTLIDSAARIHRLWQWWAARRGIDFEALVDVMHGRPAVETIRLAAPQLVPEDEIEALETEEISDMHDVHLVPGALDLLARLDGAPWAIVTSGSTRVAEARLRYVGLPRPAVLVTADLIRDGKPAPDGYLLAAKRLGAMPEDCIVVEDAPVGVAAGVAAGMRVIAVASTHPLDSLQGAQAIIARLTDMDLHVDAAGIAVRIPR